MERPPARPALPQRSIRQTLTAFLDIFLRRKIHPRLVPAQQLRKLGEDGFLWEVTGPQPLFDLAGRLPGGWLKLTVVARATRRTRISVLVDRGNGFLPANTYPVGLASPDAAIFQVFVPLGKDGLAIRLQPADGPCEVELREVILARVLYLEMLLRSTLVWLRRMGFRPREIRYAFKRLFSAVGKAGPAGAWRMITNRFTPIPDSYERWLARYAPTPAQLSEQSADAAAWPNRPRISILMPVYNPTESFLREALESVLAQSYPEWELCIADDASTQPYVRRLIEEFAAGEPRVRVEWRPENGHISAASNSALALASGEWLAMLDHDDLLSPEALYHTARVLRDHPATDMLYSDEDRVTEEGHRYFPHFKPDWSPDLFLRCMYTAHLAVYRRALVQQVGGFRPGFDGAQDWDLALRLTECTQRIAHIPRVLYSWRAGSGSTGQASSNKVYAYEAAGRALQDAVERRGWSGQIHEVEGYPGFFHLRRELTGQPLVSIVICTRDRADYLERCVRSIFDRTRYSNFEVLVVDNGSREKETARLFERWQEREPDRFRVLPLNVPFNFSTLNNHGVDQARGELVLLLNNDTEVITPQWLEWLAAEAQRADVGAVGAVLLYPNDTVQHGGIITGISGWAGHAFRGSPAEAPGYGGRMLVASNFTAVTGACLMMRRELYQRLGGLNPDLAVAGGDVELCLRALDDGCLNLVLPEVRLYHFESISRGYEDSGAKRARFIEEIEYVNQRWPGRMQNDPFYNPNLTREKEDFSLSLD